MRYLTCFFAFALVGSLIAGNNVSAQSAENIVKDYRNDVNGDLDQPTRVRLEAQAGVDMGRMAGVWGTLGEEDVSDVFFLGKTPDFARMQFDLTALKGSGATAIVTAKNGKEIVRHQIAADVGETKTVWLRLKGKILVQVIPSEVSSSFAPSAQLTYALYFWYPGDTIDALSETEFDNVEDYEGSEKPRVLHAVKGVGK
jgi:hypothetical protein